MVQQDLDALYDRLERDGISVKSKRATALSRSFWFLIHWLIRVVTFDGQKNAHRYTTTIGPWIRTGEGFEDDDPIDRIALLEHEVIHVKQFRGLGLGNAIVGIPLTFALYVLLPFPIGVAYFRYRMEREAYAVGAEVMASYAPSEAARYAIRSHEADRTAERLSGGKYGYAWIFPGAIRRWMRARLRLTK